MAAMEMDALLRSVLGATPPDTDDLATWWAATAAARATAQAPFDRALLGGAHADRLGFAFAGGYAEALRALVPTVAGISALCATEESGNHPRAIRARLEPTAGGYRLSGRKKWASLAPAAAALLIVASVGEADGKNQLRVARVAAGAPGVQLHPSAASFVPEIPHAEVELTDVFVADADLLPGDGYDAYLKPFRTVEDLHVHGALAGYLLGVTRRKRLGPDLAQRLLVIALAARSLAAASPTAATTHAALAGLLDLAHRTVADLEAAWSASPDPEWTRWQRDRRLLQVASTARAARRDRAWQTLATAG